jgi:hypothetical protein
VPLSSERLDELEPLFGKHGVAWNLVKFSTMATPRSDPAWEERLTMSFTPKLRYLSRLRFLGFDTRTGNGNRYVQDLKTKAYVQLNPLWPEK